MPLLVKFSPWSLALFVQLALFASSIYAETKANTRTVEGRIHPNEILPDISYLSPSTRIILNGPQERHETLLRSSGEFSLPGIGPGSYLLQVVSGSHVFDDIRVEIVETKANLQVRAFYSLPGTSWNQPSVAVSYPIKLHARLQSDFFMPRESFSILSLLSNPMVLMMGFSLLMFIVMPKMMNSMDPEALRELQEQQNKQREQLQNMGDLGGRLAEMLAGKK